MSSIDGEKVWYFFGMTTQEVESAIRAWHLARDLVLDLATDGGVRMSREQIRERAALAAKGMPTDRAIDQIGSAAMACTGDGVVGA